MPCQEVRLILVRDSLFNYCFVKKRECSYLMQFVYYEKKVLLIELVHLRPDVSHTVNNTWYIVMVVSVVFSRRTSVVEVTYAVLYMVCSL